WFKGSFVIIFSHIFETNWLHNFIQHQVQDPLNFHGLPPTKNHATLNLMKVNLCSMPSLFFILTQYKIIF
ncbi:MAG TPA: hypothetical protein QGG06_01385, partial [Gammaproteobacteria bacterium]|nr:hypothetical protein [Gammaproteobacteria bacterium]